MSVNFSASSSAVVAQDGAMEWALKSCVLGYKSMDVPKKFSLDAIRSPQEDFKRGGAGVQILPDVTHCFCLTHEIKKPHLPASIFIESAGTRRPNSTKRPEQQRSHRCRMEAGKPCARECECKSSQFEQLVLPGTNEEVQRDRTFKLYADELKAALCNKPIGMVWLPSRETILGYEAGQAMRRILLQKRQDLNAGSQGPAIRSPLLELAFSFAFKLRSRLGCSLRVYRKKAKTDKDANTFLDACRAYRRVNFFTLSSLFSSDLV